MNPELLELEALLEEEKLLAEHRMLESTTFEKEEKLRKLKTKEALIDDLMFSDIDANAIVASHKSDAEKLENEEQNVLEDLAKRKREILAETTARLNMIKTHGTVPLSRPHFSTGIAAGGTVSSFLPVPKKAEEVLFQYVKPEVFNNGPPTPGFEELVSISSKDGSTPFGKMIRYPEKKEIAGGYHAEYEVRRALCEAFSDICFDPKTEAIRNPFAPSEKLQGMDLDS